MRMSRIKRRLILSSVSLVGASVLIAVTCTNSNAGARRTAPTKASSTKADAGARETGPMAASTIQQQKPIKLRYYGGPKSPMYPE
jgi:hypothetical protein